MQTQILAATEKFYTPVSLYILEFYLKKELRNLDICSIYPASFRKTRNTQLAETSLPDLPPILLSKWNTFLFLTIQEWSRTLSFLSIKAMGTQFKLPNFPEPFDPSSSLESALILRK